MSAEAGLDYIGPIEGKRPTAHIGPMWISHIGPIRGKRDTFPHRPDVFFSSGMKQGNDVM